MKPRCTRSPDTLSTFDFVEQFCRFHEGDPLFDNWAMLAWMLYIKFPAIWRGLVPVETAYDAAIDAMQRAIQCFDPARGKLTTIMHRCVLHALLKEREKAFREIGRVQRIYERTARKSWYMEEQDDATPGKSVSITSLVDQLPERQRDIVRLRMEGKLLAEIGEIYGLSKERIRQIEFAAHQKLKAMGEAAMQDGLEVVA
jgi:RNA polymerase sigma factor (sigma-70 family)